MKLRIITILALASIIGVTGCGKHDKKGSGTGANTAGGTDDGKKGGTDDGKKGGDDGKGGATPIAAGELITGKDANAKKKSGVALLDLAKMDPKGVVKAIQDANARFKAETQNELIVVINAISTDGKKLSTMKERTYVASVKIGADASVTPVEVAALPVLKVEETAVELDALDKATGLIPSKANADVAVAAGAQAKVTVDANAAGSMPAVVVLKTADKEIKEITLDEAKQAEGYVAEAVLFESSYKGNPDDANKPVCVVIAVTPATDKDGNAIKDKFFTVKMENVLDLAEADGKVDFSKISKEDFAKIPAATYAADIACVGQKLDASPNSILNTISSGYTIKVVHKQEEKKDEKKAANKPAA